jgi:hypothetical protein
MRSMISVLTLVFYALGLGSCALSKTSIQEMQGLVLLLIGAVFTVCEVIFIAAELRDAAPRNGRRCPQCGETVRREARKCHYCLTDLPEPAPSKPAAR